MGPKNTNAPKGEQKQKLPEVLEENAKPAESTAKNPEVSNS